MKRRVIAGIVILLLITIGVIIAIVASKAANNATDIAADISEAPADIELKYTDTFNNCDSISGWSSDNPSGVESDNTDFKEGSGCLTTTGSGVTAFQFLSSEASTYPYDTKVSEEDGAISFWYYISDISMLSYAVEIELSSSGEADKDEYNWSKPKMDLASGWNKIVLNIRDAVKVGAPDLSAMNYFRAYHDNKGDMTNKIDDIIFFNNPKPLPLPEMDYEADPIPYTMANTRNVTDLDLCDEVKGWETSGEVSVNTTDFKEGSGALEFTGTKELQFQKQFEIPVDAGITEEDGYLEFWYYIEDVKSIGTMNQIEISSSGTFDSDEYNWAVPLLKIKNGWNLIQLRLGGAVKVGNPDITAINWFRLYAFPKGEQTVHTKIDHLHFTEVDKEAINSEPYVPKPDEYIKSAPEIIDTVYPTEDTVIADFDAADFGADPSGLTDSTQAINNALDACYKAGGGTVWLPDGKYKITGTINIQAFCTLRGDWNDIDKMSEEEKAEGKYGTLLIAEVPSNTDNTPGLVRIGGSAGVMGITVYYPNQNTTEPIPYASTFEIPGRAWRGEINYMMSSIINCTLINSYKGIGISITPSDKGLSGPNSNIHESSTVSNVKGTALYSGVQAYNGSDVSIWENVKFNNSYWAEAAYFNPPAKAAIETWTIANGYGFKLGDLEWDQFINLEASGYKIGIKIVKGTRIPFTGEFLYTKITDCETAVEIINLDERWGTSFLQSELLGNTYGILNYSDGYVMLTDCTISGHKLGGTFIEENPGTTPLNYTFNTSAHKSGRAYLYNVLDPLYGADRTAKEDSTLAIQAALTAAGKAGGGVVYLPAGWYKVSTHITVPSNVELRGASTVPNRDQSGGSMGTVIFAYEGKAAANPETYPALVTLEGDSSGIRGLRFFYPENNPDVGIEAYPYTIRGNGAHQYAINVGLTGVYNGIDFRTNTCNDHYVRRVVGIAYRNGIVIGKSDQGSVEGCLLNGNAVCRVGFNIEDWIDGTGLFPQVIDSLTRPNLNFIVIDGATNEKLLNNFTYGSHNGVYVIAGQVEIFNFGTDNLGGGGYGIKAESDETINVYNYMRYNGENYNEGAKVILYNNMQLY